eukprot:scaffold3.g6691.t1
MSARAFCAFCAAGLAAVLFSSNSIVITGAAGTARMCRCLTGVGTEAAAGQPPTQQLPLPLQPPWPPVLPPEAMRRGLGTLGSGDRLLRLAARLRAGQPLRVATLGGSVTRGAGATSQLNSSYPPQLERLLNACFPLTDGWDVDLAIIEFTTNDPPAAPYASPARRAYEQLLRGLLRRPGVAVVLLHHYAWWVPVASEGEAAAGGQFHHIGEASLAAFGQYYDIPSLSLRSAVWPLMHAGAPGFQVDRLAGAEAATAPDGTVLQPAGTRDAQSEEHFYADVIHPSDTGHKAIAELLAGVVARALEMAPPGLAAGAAAAPPAGAGAPAPELPPPMVRGTQDLPPSACLLQRDFEPAVVASANFSYQPERPNAEGFVAQKWGWSGQAAGAWAELELNTTSGAGEGGNSTVWLGHLASYVGRGLRFVGWGRARIECVAGCACTPSVLDSLWTRRATLISLHRIEAMQHDRCRLRATILPADVEEGGHGTKVTLAAVVAPTMSSSSLTTIVELLSEEPSRAAVDAKVLGVVQKLERFEANFKGRAGANPKAQGHPALAQGEAPVLAISSAIELSGIDRSQLGSIAAHHNRAEKDGVTVFELDPADDEEECERLRAWYEGEGVRAAADAAVTAAKKGTRQLVAEQSKARKEKKAAAEAKKAAAEANKRQQAPTQGEEAGDVATPQKKAKKGKAPGGKSKA